MRKGLQYSETLLRCGAEVFLNGEGKRQDLTPTPQHRAIVGRLG